MAQNKTLPNEASVADFLAGVTDPARRADAQALASLFARVTGEAPRMWGGAIVGFGSYHYRYESGREGDSCRLGFSPRKAELVLYILSGGEDEAALLARLGRHKAGKGCLYLKRLADIDLTVLEDLVRHRGAVMDAAYPR